MVGRWSTKSRNTQGCGKRQEEEEEEEKDDDDDDDDEERRISEEQSKTINSPASLQKYALRTGHFQDRVGDAEITDRPLGSPEGPLLGDLGMGAPVNWARGVVFQCRIEIGEGTRAQPLARGILWGLPERMIDFRHRQNGRRCSPGCPWRTPTVRWALVALRRALLQS